MDWTSCTLQFPANGSPVSNQWEDLPRLFSSQVEEQSVNPRKRKRKRTRRGKTNQVCKFMTNFVLLHSNIRGLKSKLQSLNHVANSIVIPDCISLNEHGLRGENKVKIENYYSFSKNRSNKRIGGVSLSISEEAKALMKNYLNVGIVS